MDVNASATGSSYTPAVTTAATSAANELVIGAVADFLGALTITPDSGLSIRSANQRRPAIDSALLEKSSGATGARLRVFCSP